VIVTTDPNDESGIVEMVAGNRSKTSRNRPATASHTPGERDWSAILLDTRRDRICRTEIVI